MAKVQEAKEIPTVKVLDSPQIPDKKSYPPRTLIVFIGTVLAVAVAVVVLFLQDVWAQTDGRDERKVFAQEVFTGVLLHLPKFWTTKFNSQNGGEKIYSNAHAVPLGKDQEPE